MTKQDFRFTARDVRAFRKAQGWSAARLGVELGNGIESAQYSRSYVKHIEGGSLPLSRFFRERFATLRARVIGEQVHARQVLMRGRFPKRLVIAGKVKRCPVCGWHFVGAVPNQKYCGDKCARQVRRA